MGKLIDGVWHDVWYDTKKTDGRFVRKATSFRGEMGPGTAHPIEAGRYHLYVSYACPWANRTLIMRALKGLEAVVSVDVVEPLMLSHGWEFSESRPDSITGKALMHEVYSAARADYTGRVTVPVLLDKQRGEIVNNESSEIIRLLDADFSPLGRPDAPWRLHDFYPQALRADIDPVNERVYHTVNNGVYKAGFATSQAAYEEAVGQLFDSLDWLEARLETQPWLAGEVLTEADLRLFTTLVRFDSVYHGHFKCNRRRIVDYPQLWDHTRAIAQLPGVSDTVPLDEIKQHYYASHESVNPTRVVAVGPQLDFEAPTQRTPQPARV